MNKEKIILIAAIILLFVINYSFFDKAIVNFLGDYGKIFSDKYVGVDRVIDGDTIVVNEESVRLLGINSPEKGEAYYREAKEFLEGLVSDKAVRLEYGEPKYDRYHRVLAFVFLINTNINIELVRWGLANVYVLNNRRYESQLRDAWKECIEKNVNLCEKSEHVCVECIEIKKFEGQTVVLGNKCDFDCSLDGWGIKDEGRKKFIFGEVILESRKEISVIAGEGEDSEEVLYWRGESYVWTKTGDTLFLRDDVGKLVLWERY